MSDIKRIMECVPNFSEGQRPEAIAAIAAAIDSVNGTKMLHVDPGFDANRTVITFAGNPDSVVESAFRAVKCAAELIDMRTHTGRHPRIGATDVLPLVPVQGITLEECAEYARKLSRRIYEELGIPIYCYEAAAYKEKWSNLAVCRRGEYEALPERIADPDEMPDYGGGEFTEQAARSGASVVGARKFLIAVNFNLNKEASVECAKEIALDVHEKGRIVKRDGVTVTDSNGVPVRNPGTLKACKAIGWYIEEYGFAQVSMNITDIDIAPLHKVYEEVCRAAAARGARVTGTEIIGLVPQRVLVEAGHYFTKQIGVICANDDAAIDIAADTLNLSEIAPYIPSERIIEKLLADTDF
jgi:glutamate formiminotransferase/formiminotetrahydrofolate cyclodeaminase